MLLIFVYIYIWLFCSIVFYIFHLWSVVLVHTIPFEEFYRSKVLTFGGKENAVVLPL